MLAFMDDASRRGTAASQYVVEQDDKRSRNVFGHKFMRIQQVLVPRLTSHPPSPFVIGCNTAISCLLSADVFNRVREPVGIRERNARTVLFRATGAQLLACKRRQCRRMLLSLVIGSHTILHVAEKGKGKTVQ